MVLAPTVMRAARELIEFQIFCAPVAASGIIKKYPARIIRDANADCS